MWRSWSQNEVSSRNLTGGEPRFRAIDTWSSPQKNLILTLRYLCQNFRSHVVALIVVERFRIVTHCYAVLLSRKLILCKTNNIIYSREYYIWHKDNKFWKFIKKWTWGHVGQFSKFCLRQLLFAFKEFRMKTRLLNISKTTNATNFTKTILRSSYKVLLGRCNLTAPKRHIFLLRALEF